MGMPENGIDQRQILLIVLDNKMTQPFRYGQQLQQDGGEKK
jgi:hypothetical protein